MRKVKQTTLAVLPLEDAKVAARAAGRGIMTNARVLAHVAQGLYERWLDEAMPISAPDQSDDEFGNYVEALLKPFSEGLQEGARGAAVAEIQTVAHRCESTYHAVTALHELCTNAIGGLAGDPEMVFIVIREVLRSIARDMDNCSTRLTGRETGFFATHYGEV
jgi:hypothetical protein